MKPIDRTKVKRKFAILLASTALVLRAQDKPAGIAVVSGIVTDAVTHLPIPGAQVSAGRTITRTDSEGTYSLSVAPGRVRFLSVRQGYLREEAGPEVEVAASDALRHDFVLYPSPHISGRVVDADTGAPERLYRIRKPRDSGRWGGLVYVGGNPARGWARRFVRRQAAGAGRVYPRSNRLRVGLLSRRGVDRNGHPGFRAEDRLQRTAHPVANFATAGLRYGRSRPARDPAGAASGRCVAYACLGARGRFRPLRIPGRTGKETSSWFRRPECPWQSRLPATILPTFA